MDLRPRRGPAEPDTRPGHGARLTLRLAGVVLAWFGVQALRGRKRAAGEPVARRVEQMTGAVLLALARRLAFETPGRATS